MNVRRRGFTLIEVLVVIGIILVLVGIVSVGITYVTKGSKNNAVRVTLNNLRGMVTELDVKAGLTGKQPPHQWIGGALNTTGPFNFWKDANPTIDNPPPGDDPVLVPQVVAADYPQRFDSDAVRNTQLAMFLLTAVPANKTMLASFPTESVAKLANIAATSSPAYDESAVPIPMDPWGNPIIFVPGGGLCGDATVDGKMIVGGTDRNSTSPDIKQVVENPTASQLGPIRSPDGRPFWASAGPDGDFRTGDDNVYSFEN